MSAQKAIPGRTYRHSLIALACAAVAAPVFAQSANAPAGAASATAPQRVEVTGSRVKQIDAEGASPVQVIRREDIARTGATTVKEALDSLSAASTQYTLSDLTGSASFASGASGFALRNLGKQSTLVLLNGRRIAPFPLADFSEVFSNIDTLPLDAIDRIEILKNGGAAIYGSDAVAGVVNIITRSTYQGAAIGFTAQKSLKNGYFGERSGHVTVGAGDYNVDGWNVLANLELYSRDELLWENVKKDVNPEYAASSPGVYGATSSYSYPGNLISPLGNLPGTGAVAGCTTVVGGLCRYDKYQGFEAVPGSKRINLLAQARLKINDNTEWYNEVLASDIRAHYEGYKPYYGGTSLSDTTWGNPTTGAVQYFQFRDLPAGDPLNPTTSDIELRYRFVDAPTGTDTDTTQYRLVTGLKGTLDKFDWDTAVGIMGGTTRSLGRGEFSQSGFKTEIGDNSAPVLQSDFFDIPGGYQIGQANSAAVLNTLFPSYGYLAHNQQMFWDGTLRTDLAQLPAGPLQLATGFDLRHESMDIDPTANLTTGDIVGLGTSQVNASRNYGALFAEADIPLVKHLDLDVAGRVDKFPNFGAHFSPKAGIKFQPIEQMLFRGTFETGFRAPNLTESAPSTKYAFQPYVFDPQRCDAAFTLYNALTTQAQDLATTDPVQSAILTARALQAYDNECNASTPERVSNNPNLKPETSKSFTLGMVLQPLARWSTSIDYWNIRRKNEINLRQVQDVLDDEGSQPPGVITRGSLANDPTFLASDATNYGVTLPTVGHLDQVALQFQNLFQTMTSGVDIGLKGSVPSPMGEFGLDVDTTFTMTYKVYSNSLGEFGNNLAGRYGTPKWVVNTTFSHKIGNISQALRWVYNSRTALQLDFDDTQWSPDGCANNTYLTPQQCRVNTYNRFDYSVSYDGIKNMSIGVFIGNVFQRRPPADYRAFGAPDGVTPVSAEDAAGRTGKLIFEYKWL